MKTAANSFQQSRRPMRYRVLNWAGAHLGLEHTPLGVDLTEESLVKAAERSSGLSDWGDESFREPLRIFLDSLNTEANLNLVGRYNFRIECIRLLVNRLQLQDTFKRQPKVLDMPIKRPLFVVGLFRSGTTFLHNLLSQDPTSRWLSTAEAMFPYPPPEAATWDNDPRIVRAAKRFQFQESLSSSFVAAHMHNMRGPEECSKLFENRLIGHLFEFRANVPTYSAWLHQQDLTDAYRDFRQQLQLLGSRWSGDHWVLKAPGHIFALDALLTVFPDAAIAFIQRDPMAVVPSCCSLCAISWHRYSDQVDLNTIGERMSTLLAQGVARAAHVRSQANDSSFYDVDYADLMQDPVGTVRQIQKYFGYEFSEQMAENVQNWIAENPQHKHGAHRYSLAQFGLNEEAMVRKFTDASQGVGLR